MPLTWPMVLFGVAVFFTALMAWGLCRWNKSDAGLARLVTLKSAGTWGMVAGAALMTWSVVAALVVVPPASAREMLAALVGPAIPFFYGGSMVAWGASTKRGQLLDGVVLICLCAVAGLLGGLAMVGGLLSMAFGSDSQTVFAAVTGGVIFVASLRAALRLVGAWVTPMPTDTPQPQTRAFPVLPGD